MTIIIIGLLLGFLQASIENEIADQTAVYLENIQERRDLAESYWALSELILTNCNKESTIRRDVSYSPSFFGKKALLNFDCPKNEIKKSEYQRHILGEIAVSSGIYGLALYALILEDNEVKRDSFYVSYTKKWAPSLAESDYKFLEKIYKKTPVEPEEIPNSIVEFFIYTTIFNYKNEEFLLVKNDIEFTSILKQRFLFTSKENSLKSALSAAIVSFLLFNQDRYTELNAIHTEILHQVLFPSTQEKIRVFKALSFSHYALGRYDKSLEIQRNIISPISKYYENNALFEESQFTQGVNLLSLGKFIEAKEIFETIYFDSTSNIKKANLFNNLSICYLNLGEKNKYINLMLEALEEAESQENYKVTLTILSNLFFYYTSIGDHASALEYLDQAGELARSQNDAYQVANLHGFTGVFYWKNEKNLHKAIEELNIARKSFNPETDFFDYAKTLKNLSQIYIEIDSLDVATELYEDLRDRAFANSISKVYIESLIGLANIALLKNNIAEAQHILDTIQQYPLSDILFKTLVKYHTIRAEVLFKLGEKRKALESLKEVTAQVIDRARTSIDTQTGYWVQEQEYLDIFNSILAMMIDLGHYQEAVQLLDNIKTINDIALYNSPILRAKRLSEKDLALDRLLNEQIVALRSQFLNTTSETQRRKIAASIQQLSAQREDILNKIRTEIPSQTLPIWSIQQTLTNNEVILHFTEVGDYLYLCSLGNDEIEIQQIDFKTQNKILFSKVADDLARGQSNMNELYAIYKQLNLNINPNSTDLIVIPDNYMYRIPLDILPTQKPRSATSYGSSQYMIETYHIKYFTSLYEYWNNSRNIVSHLPQDFTVFAISDFSNFKEVSLPTLPFATKEARSIYQSLNNFKKKNIYIGTEATKQAFLDEASSAKIVHIATHSEVSEKDPLFSVIYLNNEDPSMATSSLYAYELFEPRLNTELIMLNSCSSGSGEYLQGSGIMGINRALRYAGAKSLALNLWSVNDKIASEFAEAFYEAINQGKDKSEAMRYAKLSLLTKGNANPHYWGAYMLIGNPSPLTKKPAQAGFMFSMLLFLVVIILLANKLTPKITPSSF